MIQPRLKQLFHEHQKKGTRATLATYHAIVSDLYQAVRYLAGAGRCAVAVSNDNPYSESLFKTLKYRPAYPRRAFENLLAARQWVGEFVQWYNEEHRHSAINFVTPAERHAGLDTALLEKRTIVYEAAKKRCPERWSGTTRNWQPILVVHLNPDQHIAEKDRKMEGDLGLKMAA